MTISCLQTLHRLTLPTPWSVGDVNTYLLEPRRPGETLTLLDTGPNWPATETTLRDQLDQYGYSLQDIGQIVISHPHPDHYGLAAKLVTESGAAVLAHPYGQATLAAGSSNHAHTDAFYQNWFEECGVPAAVQTQIGQAHQETHNFAQPVTITQHIHNGEQLKMGGHNWQVLYTPGHSGGMLCFFQPKTRILLASDHLIGDISSNPIVEPPVEDQSERPKRLLQYLQQLERVAALQPAVAFPGHGPAIHNVAKLVQQRKTFHQARAQLVWEQIQRDPQNVYQLASKLFRPTLPSLHLFLALSEIQGHLDLLVNEGRAGWTVEGKEFRWFAT